MAVAGRMLMDRFEGCLLGLAVGDALGGKFEGQSAEAIRARFPSTERLIDYPQEEIWYTDDTQMAIGVCEAQFGRGAVLLLAALGGLCLGCLLGAYSSAAFYRRS